MGFALVWLASFALYLTTLCPTITAGDTAELLLAGLRLDITHPPGYPVLAMLVRLAVGVPAGSLMFRAGLVSAAAGAFAVACLWSTLGRLGASRTAAALGAALFAVTPLAWWQATMLEKYALQLALAAFVLRLCLPEGTGHLRAIFGWSLAFAHHSIAVFLLPVLALPLWRNRGRMTVRAACVAAMLAFLPLSVKPVYTAIRSDALHRAEAGGLRSINWCEPYRAGALLDYLRVRYYAARFASGTNLERATWRDHLGYFPRELTWPGLLLGIAGLVLLARRRPAAGAAVLGALGVSAAFNSRFLLPPSLAAVYHQDAFLLLALGAGVAADAGLKLLAGWRAVASAAAFAMAAALYGWAASRAPAQDASRHFLVHDYNRGQLALAPRGAVFIGCFDYDMFALRYFQEALGVRADLVPLQAPVRLGPGQFVVRRHYRPWAAALLPGAVLRFTEDDSGFTILRRLVADNPGLCFVVSGLSSAMAPGDLFRSVGNLFMARTASCGTDRPGRPVEALRAVSDRSWLSPGASLPIHRTMVEIWAQDLGRASSGTGTADRERLLRSRLRLIPYQAPAWGALAMLYAETGRPADAVAAWQKAFALDPASVELHLDCLRYQLRIGATEAAAGLLRETMSRAPFNRDPAAARAIERLDRRDLAGAVQSADRAFAAAAIAQGEALPGNPEADGLRLRLFEMAAALAPDWADAQRRVVRVLQGRSRYDEAGPYVARLRDLDPAETGLLVSQAAGWMEVRRFDAARDLLERLARAHPDLGAAWFYLGQARLAAGDRIGALRSFDRFLALSPDSPMAPSIRGIVEDIRRK
ncbi:MAG: tetratricopeptide repeat protein [Candidatus Coatesbacteria bacterium]